MKIISPFKDYYDGAACYNYCHSDDRVYVRKTSEKHIDLDVPIPIFPKEWQVKRIHYTSYLDYVGFCGEVYCLKRIYAKSPKSYSTTLVKDVYVTEKEIIDNIEKKGVRGYPWSVENSVNQFHDCVRKIKELFETYEVPVFLINNIQCGLSARRWVTTETNLFFNPKLSDLRFGRVMPPTQAYQNIEMFLGTILIKHQDPAQITDSEVLAAAKGFDKWSFRKLPTKRKKRG